MSNQIILHQVNCQGVMGSGFAKYVADTFPILYKDYKMICFNNHRSRKLMGKVFIYFHKDYTIINMFSQFDYGGYKCHTDYEAMENALKFIRQKFPDKEIIAPKYIGCHRGGGDWSIVSKLLEKYNISTSTNIIFKLDKQYEMLRRSIYGMNIKDDNKEL